MTVQIILAVLIISMIGRGIFQLTGEKVTYDASDGTGQTTGNREIQADAIGISITTAGKLAVMADGIGKENTGKVCASLAVKEFMEAFSFYKSLHNPEYFFERTMYSVHMNMQKTLEERRGGASVGAVFLADGRLYYAMAGQIRIALLRNGELIPLSEGQTIGVLAQRAYKDGRMSRQETIWSMEDTEIWNYVGKDGFHQMEVGELPVELKKGDLVVMMTKGIFDEVSYADMEKILTNPALTAQEKADRIIRKAEWSDAPDKENGSVMVLLTDGAMRI